MRLYWPRPADTDRFVISISLPASPLPHAQQPAKVAGFLSAVYVAYTGRGPEAIRSIVAPEAITVILRNTLTQTDRTLRADGRADSVSGTRHAIQTAMREELCNGIEAITGRRVESFLSDHDITADIAVEVFVLAKPAGSEPT